MGGRNGLLHGAALHQADSSSREDGKGSRHRNDAQSADLDQQNNDRLAELGPIGGRVVDHQARHTNGGGRREQRIQKGRDLPIFCGDGEHQQKAPQ